MFLNRWDIKEAGAEQRRLTVGHHEIKNRSEWNESSTRPTFIPPGMSWKTIDVEVMVRGNGYQDIVEKTSTLLAHAFQLTGKEIVNFDGYTHDFYVVLSKYSITETVKKRWHIIKLTFQGYESVGYRLYTATTSGYITLTNNGNIDAPVTIRILTSGVTWNGEVIADSDGGAVLDRNGSEILSSDPGQTSNNFTNGDIVMTNLSKGSTGGLIVVHDMLSGSTVTIDAISGLISSTAELDLSQLVMGEMPSIPPGDTQVLVTMTGVRSVEFMVYDQFL